MSANDNRYDYIIFDPLISRALARGEKKFILHNNSHYQVIANTIHHSRITL